MHDPPFLRLMANAGAPSSEDRSQVNPPHSYSEMGGAHGEPPSPTGSERRHRKRGRGCLLYTSPSPRD
eukprot:5829574-Alexandrium_andersonii.AAC.1